MRCPSYGGCKTLTAATVGVFFFAERISNTGLTGIALEHRPEAVMLCYIVGGPIVQIIMGVLIMKQKNGESNSAAYKSRTKPAQYIVVVKLDGSTQKAESIEHEGIIYDRTDHVEFDLDSVPDYVRDRLAAATLECYREFIKKPGAIELLDKKIRERKAAKN